MASLAIITDGDRRRRWSATEDHASISVTARRNGVALNLLYRWRRLVLEGGSVAVTENDDVSSNRSVLQGFCLSVGRNGGQTLCRTLSCPDPQADKKCDGHEEHVGYLAEHAGNRHSCRP